MIKLDNRLTALLGEIEGEVLADIGCDHGKLAVASLLEGKCSKVIAGDISAESLKKAVKLAKEYGLEEKIDCRVSDGFDEITEDLSTALIAGLGGYEIREILKRRIPKVKRFVLCPHQNVSIARKAINAIGYTAIKDFVVKEGSKYYQIIVAEKGAQKYADNQLRFGLNSPRSHFYDEMLLARKNVIEERFCGREIPAGEMQSEYQEILRCLK